MAVKLVTAATEKPVTLAEAKAHLRVIDNDEDTLIESLIAAATGYAEQFTGRSLVSQVFDLYLDKFPAGEDTDIIVPMPPIIDVEGLFYRDSNDAEQEFDAASYLVDNASEPARLVLFGSSVWPTTGVGGNAVRVRYRSGYVDNLSSPVVGEVPGDIKAAILLHIGSLYANRETVVVGQSVAQIPWGAEQLLRMRRVHIAMA